VSPSIVIVLAFAFSRFLAPFSFLALAAFVFTELNDGADDGQAHPGRVDLVIGEEGENPGTGGGKQGSAPHRVGRPDGLLGGDGLFAVDHGEGDVFAMAERMQDEPQEVGPDDAEERVGEDFMRVLESLAAAQGAGQDDERHEPDHGERGEGGARIVAGVALRRAREDAREIVHKLRGLQREVGKADMPGSEEPQTDAENEEKDGDQPEEHVQLKQRAVFAGSEREDERKGDREGEGPVKKAGGEVPDR